MICLKKRDLTSSLTERESYFHGLQTEKNADYILLRTCNRIELYQGDGYIPPEIFKHLFRVVCGLESAIVGENAIQGQVKCAYLHAQQEGHLSKSLHRLFQNALRVGKRVRTETDISRGAMSHGQAVMEHLKKMKFPLAKAKILVLGVNHLNTTIIRYLSQIGNKTTFITNRTYEKALNLGKQLGCSVLDFKQLKDTLIETDLVISATGAPHFVIKKEDIHPDKKLLIYDLAVPRDVQPEVCTFPNIMLFNIEDIEKGISHNSRNRQIEVQKADNIIEDEVSNLITKQLSYV